MKRRYILYNMSTEIFGADRFMSDEEVDEANENLIYSMSDDRWIQYRAEEIESA